MQAVILAGGRGSRLNELTKDIPKPMIKIGDLPVLGHQIKLLRRYGIKDIVILTKYLSEKIESYFKDGRRFGVNITYFEEREPLGTAGGLKEIENGFKKDFLVVYGDVMLDMDVLAFINFHKKKKSACTLVVHPTDHPFDSDLLEIDKNSRVVAFYPKPHDKNRYYRNLSNAASLYVLSPKILKYIKKGKKADFGKDIFPKIVGKEIVYGYNTAEYIKDMGTPERLSEVERDYQSGKIERFNISNKRRAIFIDRDGVINEEIDLLHRIEDFKLLPKTSEAIKKINDSEFLAILVTNQPVVARNLCSLEDVEEIHKKMETLFGKKGAKLDGIYFCPHHPDKGYPEENPEYKIECECRKPKIGMILKAARDYNIDLENSWMIGDSERDIELGVRAGVKTILVKRNGREFEKCSFNTLKSDNIYSAVKSIIYDNNKNAI